jgi:toxin ParE1/3/4
LAAAIHKRAAAERDLIDHYVYLAENAGLDNAERFLSGVETSFSDLSQHPKMGSPVSLHSSRLAGLRKWPVRGFENILIFYLPRGTNISILRVLHAARDWWDLLGMR